jgi:hypothetical protein
LVVVVVGVGTAVAEEIEERQRPAHRETSELDEHPIDEHGADGLSFPKIASGLDSHRLAESAHDCGRCLQS